MRINLRRLTKYAILGVAAGATFLSLQSNDYDINSIGIVRLGRAAVTVFTIGSIYKKNLYKDGIDTESSEYLQVKSYCHKQAAERLLDLCCINRGVYIKVGQHIAALDYLLPPEYVQTLKVLHSHAPTNKLEDIYKVLKEDLKRDPNTIYKAIDPEPLGTASLAQVHKATLLDGSVVAIKVQHPYVQGNARVDLKTMEALVKIVGWVFPEFKFQWLVDETKKNIPQELNFEQEAQNAEKVAKLFKHFDWLKIPGVRWDLTTSRVLTMEFIEGGQVNDLEYINKNNINPFEVTNKLGVLYSQMIFIHGFVHSDPHPGNILLKKNAKGNCNIILLDHGLYATLSDDFRREYANLWLSILNRDRNAMKIHSANLGIHGKMYGLLACMVTGRTWDTVMHGVERQKLTVAEKESMQQLLPNILPEISGVLQNVNRQMILILRTNDLMRGIEHTLRTRKKMESFKVMSECCLRCVYLQKLNSANSMVDKFKIFLNQFWLLFKLNVYYTLLNIGHLYNSVVGFGQKSVELAHR